jgi:predicted nucleic acid-binding protein
MTGMAVKSKPEKETIRLTVDASVWMNARSPKEKGYLESKKALMIIEEMNIPVFSPSILIVELSASMSRATGDEKAGILFSRLVSELPNIELMPITLELAKDAAVIAARLKIRGADALYCAVAADKKAVLLSRDKEQVERAKALIKVMQPEDFIAAFKGKTL